MTDTEPVLKTYQVDLDDSAMVGGGESFNNMLLIGSALALAAAAGFLIYAIWQMSKNNTQQAQFVPPVNPTAPTIPAPQPIGGVPYPVYVGGYPMGHSMWRPWSRYAPERHRRWYR